MTRAKETATDIHKHVSHLPVETSDLLREGAPIPPEPPLSQYQPEDYVSHGFHPNYSALL